MEVYALEILNALSTQNILLSFNYITLMQRKRLDYLIAILILLRDNIMGRYQLSKLLNLGEGITRNFLKYLKEKGYIDVIRGGSKLNEEGMKFLSKLLNRLRIRSISEINLAHILKGNYSGYGAAIPASYCNLSTVTLRDEVVRNGAKGALILIKKGEIIEMPHISNNIFKDYPNLANEVVNKLKPRDNDLIIIAFSENLGSALLALIRTLLRLNNLIS